MIAPFSCTVKANVYLTIGTMEAPCKHVVGFLACQGTVLVYNLAKPEGDPYQESKCTGS